jgi:hypothetical protein
VNRLTIFFLGFMPVLVGCNAVLRDLEVANLDSHCRLWAAFESNVDATDGRIKRWPTERELIAVEMPVTPADRIRVERALTEIEQRLRGKPNTLFARDGRPRERERGLVFSMKTACGAGAEPGYSLCGNVSRGPGDCGSPLPTANDRLYNPAGELDGLLWINLDTRDVEAGHECIVHEVGHALGLGAHFPGFSDQDSGISEHFWDVLRTLYHNPPGTEKARIHVIENASMFERWRVSFDSGACSKR